MKEYLILVQRKGSTSYGAKIKEKVFAPTLDSAKRAAIDRVISKGIFGESDRSMLMATQIGRQLV